MNELIMKLLKYLIVLAAMFTALPLYGEPLDLSTAWQKAKEYDARLGAAQADNLMYQEEVGKARAQLRPSVRMNAARGRNATQYTGKKGDIASSYYNSVNYGVSVRQPLLNLSNIAAYKQAKTVAAKSDVELQKEEAALIVRITEAYCNALFAEDNLDFSQALVKAVQEQLQQAKRRFEKGFGTITEINEAQANYDMALADGLEIVNSVELTRRELEHLSGQYPDELCKLIPEKLVLADPMPKNVQYWIDQALAHNRDVVAGQQEIQIAKREIEKQKYSRYPTVDLVGGRSYSESENNYSIGSIYDTYSISLQMSMPIYTGGYVSASVRQAHAKWLKAQEQLSLQEREVQSNLRKYFNGIISGIAQIHAYEQAVKSNEIALTGTKKGFEAGLRSNVEVLDAQQKLFASRRNLAKSRYQYILNRLMLKQASGTLSDGDIEEVNGWLVAGTKQAQ
jgi:protease secretion system outer membrane protein